ncbi:MAG: chromosome segregation protein SMC [Alphaproteobacteria bacterium]|nr:chromosome segregation protein SMC [Alphaproteobacteria bacterium]
MDFTKLKITGFKSFVERTELDIEKGLTGIVGPNGCGKSNIVDALKWIMGETSPKEMRGKGMDDVIFNGTSIRPQNDLAEIEIEIDNKKRKAPEIFNDYETIEIKRKIEREKGSTYYINNKVARAKDVRLLFADASSGPDTTSIVAQGQVHRLISSKPEERRILLEEAAGITGLHARRHEAELKLKSAEINLSRLEDIIKTHKEQFKILEKQAKEAEKYKTVKDKINKLEITIIKIRCINNINKISKKTERLEKISFEINKIDSLLENYKNEKNKFLSKSNEKNNDLNNLKNEKQKNIDEINRVSIQKDNLKNRLKQLTVDISREKKFLEDANFSLSKLQKNIFNETKELDIKISNSEKNSGKENFINLKKDIENELKKIEFIISKSNELNSKIDELKNKNNNLITPIKSTFDIISEKIKSVFSSFTDIKNNFSKLTNLDKIFDFEEEHAKWSKRIDDAKKHLEELVEREKFTNNELINLEAKPDELNKRNIELDIKINQLEKEITIDPNQTKEIDKKIKINSDKKIESHEEKTRLETDLEYLKNDLDNAYQESENNFNLKLNEENLKEEKINVQDLPAKGILQNDLNVEKRKFDKIGPINFTAENEAMETNKKIEKMVNEKIDVEKAILKLRETISSINKEGREKINKCFDGVNQNFQNLFTQFFDGGKSYLKMIGSTDPLLSGLEVFASPPGKKMNTLSLLSGGEKTMAATALILAVFLQNPSPICVLDEVDAPLDDINIEKYCKVIKKINHDTLTKFVIITHNPITMAHMDRLYGVTMAETGVSKLISVQLEEAQKLREVS